MTDQAAEVVGGLLEGYFGDEKRERGAGLLVVRGGRFHTPRCPEGQWLTPGLRGDPCSARCAQIDGAIALASVWLAERGIP